MNRESDALRDAIKVLNDGVSMYTSVQDALRPSGFDRDLQALLQVRLSVLAELQPLLYAREGEVEESKTLTGTFRQALADLLANIKVDQASTYFMELEALELRTLEALNTLDQEAASADLQVILSRVRVSMQACLDTVRAFPRKAA